MYSSYSLSERLVLVHFLAVQLLLIRSVSSLNLTNAYLHHKCLVNQGNYKPGSEYEKNLNFLIRSISTENFKSGFEGLSFGEGSSRVAIRFLCRGDSYGSICFPCYATAVAGLRRRCERNKAGIIWYDQCFLEVSNIEIPVPRKIDQENSFSMHNPSNVNGDIQSFNKKTEDFLYSLIPIATRSPGAGNEPIFYAAGETMLGTKKLYAMVQCTKDIAVCKGCLEWSIGQLSKCCVGKQGSRVLSTTCNLRYELYPFMREDLKPV
ncbi:unnamed protein product [Microthlaspi erraticum]|uniref:Gnk2-homologous domain-containing protein n=1 Tax=Microthlaspi erraticum TaxID=1685480 RepID=A0A6D2IJ07_9BRAS|nr:unnamed protein product [Microthlaspi erraticum]